MTDVELRIGPRGGRRGRDALAAVAGTRFGSASHTGELLVLAVCADAPVGVDVEEVRPRERALAIARSRLHPDEAGALEQVPTSGRDEAFARLWTAKEAVLKARGTGLAGGLATFAVLDGEVRHADDGPWALATFDPAPGVVGTVAVRATGPVRLVVLG